MILEDETHARFGYRPDELPPKSVKKIVYRCDACGENFETQLRRFNKSKTGFCHRCAIKSLKGRKKKRQPDGPPLEAEHVAAAPIVAGACAAPEPSAPVGEQGDRMSEAKTLSVADMARIASVPDSYIAKCVKVGYISLPVHATETWDFVGGQENEAAAAKASEEVFRPKIRTVTAEEQFTRFWKGPYGKERLLNPTAIREVELMSRGFPWDYRGALADKAVEKVIANVWNAVSDDDEMVELTPESYQEAVESP